MGEPERESRWTGDYRMDVDQHGVPIRAFGDPVTPEFFEVLGKIVSVNGQIEYLQDRLGHLPMSETSGVRKLEQFLARFESGRSGRNEVVHSRWLFGADTTDPDVIFGVRYKVRKQTTGDVATVSIHDVPDSEREQETVQHTLDSLRKLLRRDVTTMRIGEQAYTEIMLKWAAQAGNR